MSQSPCTELLGAYSRRLEVMYRNQKQTSKSYWTGERGTPQFPGQPSPGPPRSSAQLSELLYKGLLPVVLFRFVFSLRYLDKLGTTLSFWRSWLLRLQIPGFVCYWALEAEPRESSSLLTAGLDPQSHQERSTQTVLLPFNKMNHGEAWPLLGHTSAWPCPNPRQLSWYHLPVYVTGISRVAKGNSLGGWEVSTHLSPF